MKKIFSAGIVIYRMVDEKPYYLLLHYSAGHWEFPKGKVEAGEALHEAALRELHEETGIQEVNILPDFQETISYFFTDQDKQRAHKEAIFFAGLVENPEVKLSHEHQAYVWLAYEQALNKLTFDNARMVLQQVHKHIKEQKTIK